VQRNWKGLLGGCVTIALAIAGVYLTGLYGEITLKYARWTLGNDFRDGCINDLDHNLTLAEECFVELARPRVSVVNMKRHLEAVQDACLDNALYWTVAICIPVLTCVVYLVWMRTFARDGPRPLVSLVKMDFSGCGQEHHGIGDATLTQIDEDLYDLKDIWKDSVYDHQQQAAMDSLSSDSAPGEDYFQAWKDMIKNPREDASSSAKADSRMTSVSSLHLVEESLHEFEIVAQDSEPPTKETHRSGLFEVEFIPLGNRFECQHIDLDVPSDFRPTDGVKLEVKLYGEHSAKSIFKVKFEKGATGLIVIWKVSSSEGTSVPLKLKGMASMAVRLGLPSHRFVYIVVTYVTSQLHSLPLSGSRHPEISIQGANWIPYSDGGHGSLSSRSMTYI